MDTGPDGSYSKGSGGVAQLAPSDAPTRVGPAPHSTGRRLNLESQSPECHRNVCHCTACYCHQLTFTNSPTRYRQVPVQAGDPVSARLAESGGAVLCGVQGCDNPFGQILYGPEAWVHTLKDTDCLESPARPSVASYLFFYPGWAVRPDGVWDLTRYAHQQVSRGRPPKFRRGLDSDEGIGRRSGSLNSPRSYPAVVACWACKTQQVVDAAEHRLSVVPVHLPPYLVRPVIVEGDMFLYKVTL